MNVAVRLPSQQVLRFVEWSGSLYTEKGLLSKRDMVQYTHEGVLSIGFITAFASTAAPAEAAPAAARFFARIESCHRETGTTWSRRDRMIHVVRSDDIVGSVPYITTDGGAFWPHLHPTA